MTAFQTKENFYNKYYPANASAIEFLNDGRRDYVAARCLLLNNLLSQSLTLASQAVEKLLKAHYILRGGPKDVKNKFGHRLLKLTAELSNIGFDLSTYSKTLNFLEAGYSLRYTDEYRNHLKSTKIGSLSLSYDEFSCIDDLSIHLLKSMPGPEELRLVLCYNPVWVHVLWNRPHHQQPEYNFLVQKNDALNPLLAGIIDRTHQLQAFWEIPETEPMIAT